MAFWNSTMTAMTHSHGSKNKSTYQIGRVRERESESERESKMAAHAQ